MKARAMTFPELGLIAATRGMLGAGIGLLIADRLSNEQRKAVGWTLVGVGVVTTFPLIWNVLSKEAAALPDRLQREAVTVSP
jgi:uncharacterized membrane protein YfcA